MAGKIGGAREGAGRPKGSTSKLSQAITAEVLARGITPIEVMLETMRRLWAAATSTDPEHIAAITAAGRSQHTLAIEACEIASKAAQYCHPKLNSVEVSGRDGNELTTKISYEVVR